MVIYQNCTKKSVSVSVFPITISLWFFTVHRRIAPIFPTEAWKWKWVIELCDLEVTLIIIRIRKVHWQEKGSCNVAPERAPFLGLFRHFHHIFSWLWISHCILLVLHFVPSTRTYMISLSSPLLPSEWPCFSFSPWTKTPWNSYWFFTVKE